MTKVCIIKKYSCHDKETYHGTLCHDMSVCHDYHVISTSYIVDISLVEESPHVASVGKCKVVKMVINNYLIVVTIMITIMMSDLKVRQFINIICRNMFKAYTGH